MPPLADADAVAANPALALLTLPAHGTAYRDPDVVMATIAAIPRVDRGQRRGVPTPRR